MAAISVSGYACGTARMAIEQECAEVVVEQDGQDGDRTKRLLLTHGLAA